LEKQTRLKPDLS